MNAQTKFTAPKWEAAGPFVRTPLVANDRGGCDGGFQVAAIHLNVENGDSVARLMAAAPELYEALTRIMPFVDDAEDVQKLFPESACSTECREAVKFCRAALAKARGEA